MNHLYVTFRDSVGATREIDITAQATGLSMSEEELIQSYINGGFVEISRRMVPVGTVPAPPGQPTPIPMPGAPGCLIGLAVAIGIGTLWILL